jgi:phage shock protein C
MEPKKLQRITSEKVIGGVAAGLADYFGIDKVIIRVLFVLGVFLPVPFPFILTYIILWIAMPKAPLYLPAAPTNNQNFSVG